jgi:hypothetical protein
VVLLVHLTLHWDWVTRTTRKLFSRGGRERFVWLVNLLLLLSMTLCVASGILISAVALPKLGITFWRQMHDTTAYTPQAGGRRARSRAGSGPGSAGGWR